MWVSSTSPQILSLIGTLTMEIYYRAGITGNTDRQTDRHTHRDTHTERERDTYRLNLIFSPYKILCRVKKKTLIGVSDEKMIVYIYEQIVAHMLFFLL